MILVIPSCPVYIAPTNDAQDSKYTALTPCQALLEASYLRTHVILTTSLSGVSIMIVISQMKKLSQKYTTTHSCSRNKQVAASGFRRKHSSTRVPALPSESECEAWAGRSPLLQKQAFASSSKFLQSVTVLSLPLPPPFLCRFNITAFSSLG